MPKSETITSEKVSHTKWGEFDDAPPIDDDSPVDIPKESLNELLQQAMQPDALGKNSKENITEKIQINFGGPRLLNTIDLQKYHTKMLQMTDDVQQKLVKLTINDIDQAPPCPPSIPSMCTKYKTNFMNAVSMYESDFVQGISKPIPEINRKTSQILLRRCVLLVLAQIGYTEVHENTLNTFVGAIDEYYKNMMKVLHSKMDAARKGYPTQFHDIYEHTLRDLGVGGIRGLEIYYHKWVIDYELAVYRKCLKARQNLITIIETPRTIGGRRRRKQSLDESPDYDIIYGPSSSLDSFNSSVASSSTVPIKTEIPVLHLPEDDSSYVDANLYELIPDVEVTDSDMRGDGATSGSGAEGSASGPSTSTAGLMAMEIPSERGHTEDSAAGYYDVEDLNNY